MIDGQRSHQADWFAWRRPDGSRPHLTSGQLARCYQGRNTFRPASALETPNGAASVQRPIPSMPGYTSTLMWSMRPASDGDQMRMKNGSSRLVSSATRGRRGEQTPRKSTRPFRPNRDQSSSTRNDSRRRPRTVPSRKVTANRKYKPIGAGEYSHDQQSVGLPFPAPRARSPMRSSKVTSFRRGTTRPFSASAGRSSSRSRNATTGRQSTRRRW